MMVSLGADVVLYALALVLPLAVLVHHLTEPERSAPESNTSSQEKNSTSETTTTTIMTTIMQPERIDLPPPKDDPFTQDALKAFDGTDPAMPVYVAIKGAPCSRAPRPSLH